MYRFVNLFALVLLLASHLGCSAESDDSRLAASGEGEGEGEGEDGAEGEDTGWNTDTPSGDTWEDPGGGNKDYDESEDTSLVDCDTDQSMIYYLSADDSNSMASPVIVRGLIAQGRFVPAHRVRVYEFLNYYGFDYSAPTDAALLNVHAQMAAVENSDDYHLQVAVRSLDRTLDERAPLGITLSIDTSGSMDGHSIDLATRSCRSLAGSLRAGDVISLVTWNQQQNVLLDGWPVSGPDDAQLLTMCGGLETSGTTDFHEGLNKALALANENFVAGGLNRVVMLSDGRANAGIADAAAIAQLSQRADGSQIYLMGVGLGTGDGYHDTLMNVVTDAGKGAYIFIDTETEADEAFGPSFLSNVDIAARNVSVELTLPPSFYMNRFHGEHYDTKPGKVEPQHLAPNDNMIFHQLVSTCAPDLLTPESDEIEVRVNYTDPKDQQTTTITATYTMEQLLQGDTKQLIKANAIIAWTDALTELSTMEGQPAKALIATLREQIAEAVTILDGDQDLAEIDASALLYSDLF